MISFKSMETIHFTLHLLLAGADPPPSFNPCCTVQPEHAFHCETPTGSFSCLNTFLQSCVDVRMQARLLGTAGWASPPSQLLSQHFLPRWESCPSLNMLGWLCTCFSLSALNTPPRPHPLTWLLLSSGSLVPNPGISLFLRVLRSPSLTQHITLLPSTDPSYLPLPPWTQYGHCIHSSVPFSRLHTP